MQDTERPESFLRRLLWKNSGFLCLATLITLPIILGVAIGYVIVLGFVTTYRKITGKKSREEKENEATKKIRIVLGHELLDTAFTKPEELPGQKPKFIRRIPRYGSVNDSLTVSSDGNESEDESESQMEDESMKQTDERILAEKSSEKEVLDKKVEVESVRDISGDVIQSEESADHDGSRTTSASSGHYSTASEMADGRDSRETGTMEYDTQLYNIEEQKACGRKALEQITYENPEDNYEKISYVTEPTKHGNDGFVEESGPAVFTVNPSNSLSTNTSPVKYSENQNSALETASAVNSKIQSGCPQTVPTIHPENNDSELIPEKITAVKHDSGLRTLNSSHLIEIPPSLGKLKYSVHYMREKNKLQVTIVKAINLFHEKNPPSTFVKVSLLPQRFCWQKTKIIQETSNPVFNETFVISGFSHERFSHYTLLICVVNAVAPWRGCHVDHVIGELYVPLSHVTKYSSNHEKVFSQWAELKENVTEAPNLTKSGKINLALCYRPISGRLIVTIKKAKDLECDSKEKFDPYVKLALYCGGSRVGRGNTSVKRKVASPVFNEKFNFDLNADQIAYTTIVVKMMNNIDSGNSNCTGATVIGYESSGNGQEHWLCMMKCLSKHVDAWHTLYS